jgi:hypothetical protein
MLRCARTAGTSWQIQLVDAASKAGGARWRSISTASRVVAYHDQSGMLLFAHPVGSGWAEGRSIP